jgi:hypothetical protein
LISKKSSPLKPLCQIHRNSEDFYKWNQYQKQELPVAAMFVNGSGQNEQFL